MTLSGTQVELTNWSKSARSPCFVYRVKDVEGITTALAAARSQNLTVIPHGAGHSYTDAALNTGGLVIDLTPMRRILSWDAGQGIMRVEPGVTLREMVRLAAQDGWWPSVSPSSADITVGGCAAMNVNGRNAWKCGPFGATVLALDVLFPTGDARTLLPDRDLILFNAFIGSLGLLGLITAVTLQLEPIPSGYATVRRRSAASMGEIFTLFSEEEPQSDFMEAWLDGFARGDQLGRGFMTCGSIDHSGETVSALQPAGPGRLDRFETSLVRLAAGLARPVLHPAVHLANRANYWSGRWVSNFAVEQRAFYPYTYWSGAAFAGYHALLPEGVETYQAFVPAQYANEIFRQVLAYSQQQGCLPIWCVIKQHRRDPFLLSYQLDGFSLELNYQRTRQNTQTLERVLRHMIAVVIEAGGRFYLAKDHFLTHAQYRQSIGDGAVNTFLEIKRRCDPEMRLQSDLYRRVFQPAAA